MLGGGAILWVLVIKLNPTAMNPEKSFNPSSQEYEKVEHLPQKEQKNFVNVEGGFVGESAANVYKESKEQAQDESRKEYDGLPFFYRILAKKERILPEDILHAQALEVKEQEDKKAYHRGVLKDVLDGTFEEKFSGLNFSERDNYIARGTEAIKETLFVQKQAEAYEKSREALRMMGHEGLLFLSDCRTDGCHRLQGELDGENVDIHSGAYDYWKAKFYERPPVQKAYGAVGDVDLSPEQARRIFDAYTSVAVGIGEATFPQREYEIEANAVSRKYEENISNVPDEYKAFYTLKKRHQQEVAEKTNENLQKNALVLADVKKMSDDEENRFMSDLLPRDKKSK